MKRPDKISSVILWSVISAAFIGPGTVTTAVTAGSQYQFSLLWTVLFATLACIVLQEISARITIASGMTFGESLIKKFGNRRGATLQWMIGGAVILGCAAYEAGNILGAVSGMMLLTGWNSVLLTVLITAASGMVLWIGGKSWISNLMLLLVVIMGLTFAMLAYAQPVSAIDLAKGTFIPIIPENAELIVLGLVGTTIVPYNIFIGSGISKGQTIPLMRIGLIISIIIGGSITAAILMAGVGIKNFSSFEGLYQNINDQVGHWGGMAMALGLFAAGFSSAITSPYAASVIASTVFGITNKNKIRLIWAAVLLTGFAFGISGVKPIPVILAVQALNGLILPLVTAYLILVINDTQLIPVTARHAARYNLILLLIFATVLLIGLNNIDKTFASVFKTSSHLELICMVSAICTMTVGWRLPFKNQ